MSGCVAMVKIIKQASSVCVSEPNQQHDPHDSHRILMCEGPSFIHGPIPPDPCLFPQFYKRPNSAQARLEGNHQQDSLNLFLAPDPAPQRGPCSARIGPTAGLVGELLRLDGVSVETPPKHKTKEHDFGKENVRRLREIQRRCKELEAVRVKSGPVPVKALWTSSKYQKVPSKFMTQSQAGGPAVKPECQNFLKSHSNAPTRPPSRSLSRPPSAASLDQDQQLQVKGQTIDFIRLNARAAGRTSLQRSQSLTVLRDKPVPSAVIGKVPEYIKARKKQWQREEEERRRNTPDPSAPPGHTLMSEAERLETLQSLEQAHRSLVAELLSLPLRADSLRVQSCRAQLDTRLSEAEEAIRVFSRHKVYVRNNA